MNFKQIELCMLIIDVSGSMKGDERIGEVNKALIKFQEFAKHNKKLGKKLYISIIEFSNKIKIHKPEIIEDFEFPKLNAKGTTEIEKGVKTSFEELKKWKKLYNPTSIISDVYFVLITDLDQRKIENSFEEYDWSKGLKKLGRKSNFMFWGFGVDGGNLDSLRDSSYPNFFINEGLNIESLFEKLKSKIEKDFRKPFLQRFWDKVASLGSPIDWRINNFLGKQLKKEFKLKGVGISILAFSIIGGIQLIKINLEFFNNKNFLEGKFKQETNDAFQDFEDLKKKGIISKNTDIEFGFDFERNGKIYPELRGVLTYVYVDSLENFSKGEYSMNSTKNLFESGLVIHKHLDNVIKSYFSKASKVSVEVQGETDGYIIEEIEYKGEFGDIDIFVNGNTRLFLQNGDGFQSNEILGSLRGISFWTFLRGRIDLFSTARTNHNYWYKTNNFDFGGRYRRIKIVIVIE